MVSIYPSGRKHSQPVQAAQRKTLGAGSTSTKYDGGMGEVQEYLVSSSGQLSLPAAVRHRWKLDKGGPVDVLDLGFGVLTVPKGEGRRLLSDLVSRDQHAGYVSSLADDADLATT
jgi:bifunctional DNA-binding transcriptional regulator/antitoxin component of YhaV-PrlF toxin-antitoxin module